MRVISDCRGAVFGFEALPEFAALQVAIDAAVVHAGALEVAHDVDAGTELAAVGDELGEVAVEERTAGAGREDAAGHGSGLVRCVLCAEAEGEIAGFAALAAGCLLKGDVADVEGTLDAVGAFEEFLDGEELDAGVAGAVGGGVEASSAASRCMGLVGSSKEM